MIRNRIGMLAGLVAGLFATVPAFRAPAGLSLFTMPSASTAPPGGAFKKRGSGLGRRNPHQNNVQNPRGTVPNRGLRRIQGRQRADRFGA